MRNFFLAIFSILWLQVFLISCSKKTSIQSISHIDDISISSKLDPTVITKMRPKPDDYAPYPKFEALFFTQVVRINIHFMNASKSPDNFIGKEAETYAVNLVHNANKRLLENHKMRLPEHNDTPRLQPFYQYKITPDQEGISSTGIYFHTDDELCYYANKGPLQNNYDKTVIEKYAIGLDSIINVFIMPHIPKDKWTKGYKGGGTGIMLGNGVKIAGLSPHKNFWDFATLLNHEIGHSLGLRHTWNLSDGCDDTPKNPNCWMSKGSGDCKIASNNLMDYNSSQMSITPCQLGIIHRNFTRLDSRQRKVIKKQWCHLDQSKTIIVDEDVHWAGAKDIRNDVIVTKGTTLLISNRISFPRFGKIKIEPGATLILQNARLHNSCGETWAGIKIVTKGNKKGKLVNLGNSSIEDVETTQI